MTSTKPRIIVPQHGTLVDALYFTLSVNDEENVNVTFERLRSGMCVIAERSLPERAEFGERPRYFRAEMTGAIVSSAERAPNRCPVNPNHAIGFWGSGGTRFDNVSGEMSLGKDFRNTFIASDASFIVNAGFGQCLRRSGLAGFELLPFQIVNNQSLFRGIPDLEYLQVLGKNCLRRWHVEVNQNLCPLCRKAPIYCPDCGWIPVLCEYCAKPAFKEFEFSYEGAETRNQPEQLAHIVDVKNSDGADFFQYGIGETMISRRALIFLMNSGAAPFVAYSQWACIDGLTSQLKADIDKMLASPIPTDRCQVRRCDASR